MIRWIGGYAFGLLLQYRKHPRREAGAALELREGDSNQSLPLRDLVQVGQKLDLVVILL